MPENKIDSQHDKTKREKVKHRLVNKDTLRANRFRKKALSELNLKQWEKAVESLTDAVNSNPTDKNNQIILSQLQNLIKARSLIIQLKDGNPNTKNRLVIIDKIQEIFDETSNLPALSTLWQEVVRQFGEYKNKRNRYDRLIKNIAWSFLGASLLTISLLSYIYLIPRAYPMFDCSNTNGLEVSLNYPNYVANGDKETIALTIKNTTNASIDGQLLLDFHGTAKVQFENNGSNKVIIKDFSHAEQKSEIIAFSLDKPFSLLADPSDYIEFNLDLYGNNSHCISKDYHISMSPIYGLRKVLLGLVGLVLLGIFRDRINKFLIQ